MKDWTNPSRADERAEADAEAMAVGDLLSLAVARKALSTARGEIAMLPELRCQNRRINLADIMARLDESLIDVSAEERRLNAAPEPEPEPDSYLADEETA